MNIAAIITWVLGHLNYWVVLLFMTIESSFIPFPSEVVVPPAAWLAMSSDEMNFWMVVVVATIGADLGALINYYLSRWLGRPLVYRFVNSRVGRLCLLSQESVEKAEDYFREHGATATFFGRLVPGIRQLVSIPAGLSGMNVGKFLLYTTLGAGIWNMILACIGYAISKIDGVETPEKVAELAKMYSHEIGYAILAMAVGAVVYLVYKNKKRKV